MNLVIDRWLRFKRGFGYVEGASCDCEDRYKRVYPNGGVVTIEHSKCDKGQKSKGCPVMFTLYRKGELIHECPIPQTAALANDLLIELGLIPADTKVAE